MNWLMRLLGAPSDLSERRLWANQHPVRASAAAAILLAGFLSLLLLVRTERPALAAAMFGAMALFLFLVAYVGVRLRVRRSPDS